MLSLKIKITLRAILPTFPTITTTDIIVMPINTIGMREILPRLNLIFSGEALLSIWVRRKVTDNSANNSKTLASKFCNSNTQYIPPNQIKRVINRTRMSKWQMSHLRNSKNPKLRAKDCCDPQLQLFWPMVSTLLRKNRWESALAKGKVDPKWFLHLYLKHQTTIKLLSILRVWIPQHLSRLISQWCLQWTQVRPHLEILSETSWIQTYWFKIKRFQLEAPNFSKFLKIKGLLQKEKRTWCLNAHQLLCFQGKLSLSTLECLQIQKLKGKSSPYLAGSLKTVQIFTYAISNLLQIHNIAQSMPQIFIVISLKLRSKVRLTLTTWAVKLR